MLMVLLLPPALYLLALGLDGILERRARRRSDARWEAHVQQAVEQSRSRHPSRYDVDCLDPRCRLCQQLHRHG